MGADFCVTGVPVFEVTPPRLQALATIIDRLTDADFVESGPAQSDTLDEWQQELRAAVATFDGIENLRDVSRWYDWWLSGGLSYGDDPSESYTRLALIHDCAPLVDQLAAWSNADAQVKRKAVHRKLGGSSVAPRSAGPDATGIANELPRRVAKQWDGLLSTESRAVMEKPSLEAVLNDFIDVIDAAGGIYRDRNNNPCPVGDPAWSDLGDTYLRACRVLNWEPKYAGELPEIDGTMSEIIGPDADCDE